MQKEIIVTAAMTGRKIEYVLSGDLALSGNIIKKLKMSGGILLNGEKVHINQKLTKGDTLTLVFPEDRSENIVGEAMELDIIYEDEDIIAINKPPMIETHPSKNKNTGTLANGVMYYFENRFTFRVITRLDKETSGVVLIAKNALSAQRLSEAMIKREIQKEYIAVVCGCPAEGQGVIDAPIKRAEGIRRIVAEDGKQAITKYRVEREYDDLTLLKLKPITGRTHQIRVHLAYMGTPIYGDWLYGRKIPGERLRLHCSRVKFCHPSTGKLIEIEAPVPKDIVSLIK